MTPVFHNASLCESIAPYDPSCSNPPRNKSAECKDDLVKRKVAIDFAFRSTSSRPDSCRRAIISSPNVHYGIFRTYITAKAGCACQAKQSACFRSKNSFALVHSQRCRNN